MDPLTAEEVRVLGCLVEKQLTTPNAYPMTESALVAACNQTTNRDPVVSYDQSTVRRTLLNLRQVGLARMVHRPGDRVEKHRHLLDEALELSAGQVAVLSVLFLRGPQTIGELRTRTERLHPFESLAAVEAVLVELAAQQPEPFVQRMERQPGQKEARYAHLLGDPTAAPSPAVPPPSPSPARLPSVAAVPNSSPNDSLAGLRGEVEALRERVARLEASLARLAESTAPSEG